MWTPAYIPLATQHNFWGPCTGSSPFGSGIAFGGGVPIGSAKPVGGSALFALWQMGPGGSIVNSQVLGSVPSNWSLIGQRDFDGDGYADLLWRDSNTGTVAIWFMNGFQVTSTVSLGAVPSNWSVYGTGNLDGALAPQGSLPGAILWRDSITGTVAVWYLGGTSVSSTVNLGAPPLTWTLIGDDNKGDIFWHDNSYNYAMWQVSGALVASAGLGNVPSNWMIQGFGDFYGDGDIDILWRDSNTGAVAIWNLNGTQIKSTTTLGAVPNTWNVVQTGDYNGDGTSDILWQDNSGNLAIWFLSAGQVSSSVNAGNIGMNWTVQSANSE